MKEAEAEKAYEIAFARARRRARSKLGFYKHLALFMAGNAGFLVCDLLWIPGLWFHWLALVWGGGLLGHGAKTFLTDGLALPEKTGEGEPVERNSGN